MQRRTRYLFIGLGAIFFLIVAPLIVFYVGGIRYNFGDNEYDKTGILSVETDPKKATVTLDDDHHDTSPVDFRFLDPKEYVVTVTKDGYFDWSKRLEVKASKATIASGFLDKIYLLKKPPAPELLADNVVDYYLDDSTLVYLTPASINVVNTDNSAATKSTPLTHTFKRLQASPHGTHFLLIDEQQVMTFDAGASRLLDVTVPVTKTTGWQITDDGTILALRKDVLASIDPITKSETPLLSKITAFNVLNQNLYYIQTVTDHAVLAVVPVATAAAANPQVLVDPVLLDLASGQLLITEQKDVILYTHNNLYKVNASLDPIAENVSELYFDPIASTLLYSTTSELSWYEFLANKSHLITRNTQIITSPQLAASIGYAFYFQNNSIQAMELDATDHQNNYALTTVPAGRSLRIDKKAKKLYFLDGQTLKSIEIR